MGEDIQALKEDVTEIKAGVKELSSSVADLRVLIAGNYVTREDFIKHQETEEARVVAIHKKIDIHKAEADKKALNNRDYTDTQVKSLREDRWKIAGLAATFTGIVIAALTLLYRVVFRS